MLYIIARSAEINGIQHQWKDHCCQQYMGQQYRKIYDFQDALIAIFSMRHNGVIDHVAY
jgi:hypothetical protein